MSWRYRFSEPFGVRSSVTIKIPGPSLGDFILNALGKKRGILIPDPPEGMDVTVSPRKEPFLRALLRPKKHPLPEGWVDYYEMLKAGKAEYKIINNPDGGDIG